MGEPQSVEAAIDLIVDTLDRAHLISGEKKEKAIIFCEHKSCQFFMHVTAEEARTWQDVHEAETKEEGKKHKQWFVWWF